MAPRKLDTTGITLQGSVPLNSVEIVDKGFVITGSGVRIPQPAPALSRKIGNRGNSQAVGYAIRVGMTWLGGAARVWRILQPCFLAVETTDLRRAKI